MEMLSAYVTNLHAYNAGALIGKWVKFPIDEDDMNDIFYQIGVCPNYENINPSFDVDYLGEEWFISDYDGEFGSELSKMYGEYANIETLNEIAEQLEAIENIDEFRAVLENCLNLEEALTLYEKKDYTFYEDLNMYDVAYDIANVRIDCMDCSESEKDFLKSNFNYQGYADELESLNFYETDYGVLEMWW